MRNIERIPPSPGPRFYEALSKRSLIFEANVVDYDHPHFTTLRRRLGEDYRQDGVVDESQLNDDGTLIDHYKDQSVVFNVSKTGEDSRDEDDFMTGARLIFPTLEDGLYSLQARIDDIDPYEKMQLMQRYEQDPGSIAELATHYLNGEASPYALIALYRGMAQFSKENGVHTWVIALRPNRVEEYTRFMQGAMHQTGEEVHVSDMKKTFVPFVIDVDRLHDMLFVGKLGEQALVAS